MKNGITWEIIENGNPRHPYYLDIRIDGECVVHKKFITHDKAEEAVNKEIHTLLTRYHRLIKGTANILNKSGIMEHCDKQNVFTGTNHY